ncbi:MAG: sigma 54-interacting transcriptional regulator [Casimicrobiaceae bacterium]
MSRIDGKLGEALAAVAGLTDCNPFVPERVELEQRILGAEFVPFGIVWAADADAGLFDPNLPRLRERVEEIVGAVHARLAAGATATEELIAHYRSAVFYLLWLRTEDALAALIKTPAEQSAAARPEAERSAAERAPLERAADELASGSSASPALANGTFARDAAATSTPATGARATGERATTKRVAAYAGFAADVAELLAPLGGPTFDTAHMFAVAFQARRAFHHIFRKIFGSTLPAARLRATVWESIFTRHPLRYRDGLSDRMADIPTLITGESGTGKELVARALALSQYIPFDPISQTFAAAPGDGFAAVNLAALNAELIESELFGHRKGSFTGAIEDRPGWFERCAAHGAVFLDEIGELDGAIQVKLLRVLQSREIYRVGETTPRRFAGKVLAATHRDLEAEMAAGRFREDLYYRICADRIRMPTLREQLAANPEDLGKLILIVARRVVGAAPAEALAGEVESWVLRKLGLDYAWHGNIRELEQCIRNVLVHGEYHPRRPARPSGDSADELAALIRSGSLTADQLLTRYVELVYADCGNAYETAKRLGMDRRTVRVRIEAAAGAGC